MGEFIRKADLDALSAYVEGSASNGMTLRYEMRWVSLKEFIDELDSFFENAENYLTNLANGGSIGMVEGSVSQTNKNQKKIFGKNWVYGKFTGHQYDEWNISFFYTSITGVLSKRGYPLLKNIKVERNTNPDARMMFGIGGAHTAWWAGIVP